jgi:hypothetical protein
MVGVVGEAERLRAGGLACDRVLHECCVRRRQRQQVIDAALREPLAARNRRSAERRAAPLVAVDVVAVVDELFAVER